MSEVIDAPAPAQGDQREPERISHWIGGKIVPGESGRSGPVYNPATGVQSGAVDFASVEEVDLAVAAAREAFPAWRALSLAQRAELMFAIRELVHTHRKDIARILTLEHGKVLSDAIGEVTRGLEVIEYACGIPHAPQGRVLEQVSTGIDVYSIRQPLGVVAGITPFNFPAMVPMWMWAPAIACGNTFVLKPSEKDPSSVAVRRRAAAARPACPTASSTSSRATSVAVDGCSSTRTSRRSASSARPRSRATSTRRRTKNGKRVQALGGAKNHMIVLPDADIDMAADAAVSAAYGSAGERCMAVSVVVAVGDVADRLVEAISRARRRSVKVGDGLEPDSEMGPLITREHRDRVASYLDSGREQGATVVVDGRELGVAGRRLLPRRCRSSTT